MYFSVMVHVHVAPHAQTHDGSRIERMGGAVIITFGAHAQQGLPLRSRVECIRVVCLSVRYPSRLHKNTTYSASGIGQKN